MAGISLKVPVSLLLENAKTERDDIITRHKKAVESYTEALAPMRESLAAKLREKADRVEAGKLNPGASSRYRDGKYRTVAEVTVWVEGDAKKPADKPDTRQVDRDIRLLEATSQETISVRVGSDLERYL